jgi:integrase
MRKRNGKMRDYAYKWHIIQSKIQSAAWGEIEVAGKYKKRADGRYLTQILLYYKSDGRPKYKNVYARTIKELEMKAAKVRMEIEKGISVASTCITMEQWAARWLELYKSNVAYNTRRVYDNALNSHILPAFKTYRLKDIKPHHIQELLNGLLSEGKTRTAEIVRATLNQLLSHAVKNEYLKKNVMDNVQLIRHVKPKKRALTDKEIGYIRHADLPIIEKTLITLLLTTGARKGEALALCRKDINLKSRTININKTAIVKINKMEIQNNPKTAAGNRSVPITDELYACLSVHLKSLEGDFLFPSKNGELLTHSAFGNM